MLRFTLTLCLILNIYGLLAQNPGDRVLAIHVDEYGHQWLGTDCGLLTKFDNVWKAYYTRTGLPFKVNDIKRQKTNKSELWMATTIGVIKVSYSENAVNSATLYDSLKTAFNSEHIEALAFDENSACYFATPKGIGVFVNGVWKFYTRLIDIFRNEFTSVQAKGDTIYFGTKGEGVARIVRNVDGYSGASSYIPPWSSLPGDSITCIFIDSRGNQWYGTTKGLSKHSNTEAKEGWNSSLTDEIPCSCVSNITEDKQGNIWVGTMCGLVKLSEDLSIIKIWTVQDGLPSNNIHSIFVESDQSVWVGTDFGISHFTETGFLNTRTSEYAKDFVYLQ